MAVVLSVVFLTSLPTTSVVNVAEGSYNLSYPGSISYTCPSLLSKIPEDKTNSLAFTKLDTVAVVPSVVFRTVLPTKEDGNVAPVSLK